MLRKIALGLCVLSLNLVAPATIEAAPRCKNCGYCEKTYSPSVHQFAEALYDLNSSYIQIEDGSQWQINPSNYYTLRSWQKGDRIEILVNTRWFTTSKYNYYIRNLSRYTADIEVNLVTAPITDGAYTKYIHAFDKNNRKIFLNDGTSWEIDADDAHVLSKWNGNDLIIVGKMYYLFSIGDYVLINVNHNEYVPAEQL